MAYVLDPTKQTTDEIRRVADETLGEAVERLEGLESASVGKIEGEIHQVRKRTKEARALARLVRPAIGKDYRRFNALVGDAAAELAPWRDAHALLDTLDRVIKRGESRVLRRVRFGQALLSVAATETISGGDPRVERAHAGLLEARRMAEQWTLPKGFSLVADGLAVTYRDGRSDWRTARRSPTDVLAHEWRKTAKRLWYQMRLLERSAPSMIGPLVDTLDALGNALGDDHDLAVLVHQIQADPDRFGGERTVNEAVELLEAEQALLRAPAFRLGATLYAESTSSFVARITVYGTVTMLLGVEHPVGGIADLDDNLAELP